MNSHLAECEKCRLEIERIRLAESALMSARLSIPAPGDLYAGFSNKLSAQQSKGPWLRLAYLAPAFALGMVAIVLLRPTHGPAKPGKALATTTPSPRMGRDRQPVFDMNRVATSNTPGSAARTNREDPLRIDFMSIQPGKRSHKQRSEVALIIAEEGLTIRRKQVETAVNSPTLDGVASAKIPVELQDEAAARFALHMPDVSDFKSDQTDLYAAVNDQPHRLEYSALGLRTYAYAAPVVMEESQAAFALVVQDDVRGFSAEAHTASLSEPSTSNSGGNADDSLKIEVEFDGAAGTTSF